ncbi:MAG: DUF2283 domain-containing protein [archaeon]|nr:DUF2283 domain-containing protein [archaeon]
MSSKVLFEISSKLGRKIRVSTSYWNYLTTVNYFLFNSKNGWRVSLEIEVGTRSLYYNPDTDTLDIWFGEPSSEVRGEAITENLISKQNESGEVIGFEIIELSKLNKEDMSKMPVRIRSLLKRTVDKLSIVSNPLG